MERNIYNKLKLWKNNKNRKPLILKGARQVGKTYILKEFGKKEYERLAFFDFEENIALAEIFNNNLSPKNIIEKLSIVLGEKITPDNTLIVFDEIQNAPRAITGLKYFYETHSQYHIIASGSLLGLRFNQGFSFPVGKVDLMELFPLSFKEYLTSVKPLLQEMLDNKTDFHNIETLFHKELIEHLKLYMYIGGMPEAVKQYIQDRDLNKVRLIQKAILFGYEADFSKHTTKTEAIRISSIWKAIPPNLTKENKKFTFSLINSNARKRDYESGIEWLIDMGLAYKSQNIKRPYLPLSAYIDQNKFKLFLLDTGLLGALLDISPKTIIEPNKLFNIYKGGFTENFTAQELITNGYPLYYWTLDNKAELDFILPIDSMIVPLEVKAGKNIRSKSLKLYNEHYNPKLILRTSQNNFNHNKQFFDYPLYSLSLISKLTDLKISSGQI